MRRGLTSLSLSVLLVSTMPGLARADSIAGKLHSFIDRNGFPTHGEFVENLTPVIERLALRGIDYPVTATNPGFTYRFNFETGVPERSSESLGPIFVERVETIGKGRFDLGMSYLYGKLTQFNGEDFADRIVTAGKRVAPDGTQFLQAFAADDFSLTSHVLSFSATYGISDRWDVNALVPLVWTSLSLRGSVGALVVRGNEERRDRIPADLDASAFGAGDALLRTKYRLTSESPVNVTANLGLRVPSGDAANLQGLGDTILTPGVVAAHAFSHGDIHGAIGLDVNADDLQRCRGRYAVGGTLQPLDRLALILDVLGSSSFVDDDFKVVAPAGRVFRQFPGIADLTKERSRNSFVFFVPRSDVVDLALGLKINVHRTAVAYASAIVPVTTDGLRADVIPSAGIEFSF